MSYKTKKQLKTEAKKLGIKVNTSWTNKEIAEAIRVAEELEEPVAPEPEPTLEPASGSAPESEPIPMAPAPEPVEPEPVAPAPAPEPVAPPPPPRPAPKPSKPGPRNRPLAGSYNVLWTITLDGKAIKDGVVVLTEEQAKSLLAQGAVVHVDDYEAYLAAQAAAKTTGAEVPHPAKVPTAAGEYETIGAVMRDGKKIPHGTLAYFSAEEVKGLTKPGMVAIKVPDKD